jgi:RNA polymerase sigma-70 factor (ECF subfamily)
MTVDGKTVQLNSLVSPQEVENPVALAALTANDLMSVVDRFQGPLLRYVGHMLGYGDHETEDIVQETFIRLHRQVRKRGPDSVQHLSNWLFRVAHNQTLDVIRKRSRQKRTACPSADQTGEQEQIANDMDALGEMLRQESRQVALQALSQLAPEIKQILLLKIIQGMSLREVAEVVGVSLSTVNYRLNQGLTELAGRLKRAGVV